MSWRSCGTVVDTINFKIDSYIQEELVQHHVNFKNQRPMKKFQDGISERVCLLLYFHASSEIKLGDRKILGG
jgi:hypothetical protein